MSGVASALELHFLLPPGSGTAEPVQMSALVRRGLIRCEAYNTFDVDPATHSARYLDLDSVSADADWRPR